MAQEVSELGEDSLEGSQDRVLEQTSSGRLTGELVEVVGRSLGPRTVHGDQRVRVVGIWDRESLSLLVLVRLLVLSMLVLRLRRRGWSRSWGRWGRVANLGGGLRCWRSVHWGRRDSRALWHRNDPSWCGRRWRAGRGCLENGKRCDGPGRCGSGHLEYTSSAGVVPSTLLTLSVAVLEQLAPAAVETLGHPQWSHDGHQALLLGVVKGNSRILTGAYPRDLRLLASAFVLGTGPHALVGWRKLEPPKRSC